MHPAELYIDSVLSGRAVVCRFVRLAVERHVRDLQSGQQRGLYFDREAACHAIDFFHSFLRHSKGEWAGQQFELGPWQRFILWAVFGWMRSDGTRRFREVYEEIARKNGKTTKAAGVGLYLFAADGESGAEVYSAATKRDQAKITHEEAKQMVRRSPALRRSIKILTHNLHIVKTASKFQPLGADSDTLDGLNVHGAIIDELHAHKTRSICDVLDTATSARRQPLIWHITTAGEDQTSICWEKREYARKVLIGQIEDDNLFAIIFTLDTKKDWPELLTAEESAKDGSSGAREDRWDDETVWVKANPNIGVSVKLDDLRRKAKKAQETPAAQASYQQKHLSIWVSAAGRWVPMAAYDSNPGSVDVEEVKQLASIYGAIDLSSTTDICALVLVGLKEKDFKIVPFFWIPRDNIAKKDGKDNRGVHERDILEAWVRQGRITATPGNVIDHDAIIAKIDELKAGGYNLAEIAYDPWNATKLVQDLIKKGANMVPFRQGYGSMSGPCKEFMTQLLAGHVHHGGNPVLRWMFDNVVIDTDPAGNIKPSKSRSYNRIDGAVATIMGMDRAMRSEGGASGPSVYEKRGMIVI